MELKPGKIALIGSGETSASGGKTFETVLRNLRASPKIAVLETPAGFELNSPQVAGKVGEYLAKRLQNFHPQIEVIPARKRGTEFSPDNPAILRPLFDADLIFFGPGSPTYTVRQLENSLAWEWIWARHLLGAALVVASAATIALGSLALPVYEIFKVGEDPHWKPGLRFFEPYGLNLVIIPHWNNNQGGDEVDTSHCFIGKLRFELLMEHLPPHARVIGIDEHTSLIMDFQSREATVQGRSNVHVLGTHEEYTFQSGEKFSLEILGNLQIPSSIETILSPTIWAQALAFQNTATSPDNAAPTIPREITTLVEEREKARLARNWEKADSLRKQILEMGYVIRDTPHGPEILPA